MHTSSGLLTAGAVAVLILTGCAAAPRQRPLATKPIETGPETVESTRKQLEGRWTLLSLDVTADDGRHATVDAAGVLTADSFGNLQIEYRLTESGQKALESLGIVSPNPMISTSGQVVIDIQQRRITYMPPDAGARLLDPDLAARRNNPFALERPRYYTLQDGTLTLTTRHDNGMDAATSRWKKGV